MDDLTAFVTARLDEVEATAKAAIVGPWEWESPEEVGEHIARHDPARVLREVEAMRAIVNLCTRVIEDDGGEQLWSDGWSGLSVAQEVLQHVAAAYGDHPDYRPEWKP